MAHKGLRAEGYGDYYFVPFGYFVLFEWARSRVHSLPPDRDRDILLLEVLSHRAVVFLRRHDWGAALRACHALSASLRYSPDDALGIAFFNFVSQLPHLLRGGVSVPDAAKRFVPLRSLRLSCHASPSL